MIFNTTKKENKKVYIAPVSGMLYTENMEIPNMPITTDIFSGADKLKRFVCHRSGSIGGRGSSVHFYFQNCSNLEYIEFPELTMLGDGWCDYIFGNCTKLRTAIFGSIGHPLTEFYNTNYSKTPFYGDTQRNLTITIYVNAAGLSTVPLTITRYAPWGATNATIVYRNSTTGEVLT